MKYNPNTDTVQIFYNGEWVDWKDGGLQADYLFKSGNGVKEGVSVISETNYGTIAVSNDSIRTNSTDAIYSIAYGFNEPLEKYVGQSKNIYIKYKMSSATGRVFQLRSTSSLQTPFNPIIKLIELEHSTSITTKNIPLDDVITDVGKYLLINYNSNGNHLDVYDVYIK